MRNNTSKMTMTGVFAAMITVMTVYICHIPYGANGGYIHFGDALIYMAAVFLPRPYALAAAAIGGGLADLLSAPIWAPATIVIKMLITLPFTSKEGKILAPRNIAAPFVAAVISAAGYYLAEGILFGSFLAPAASLAGSAIQSGGSAAIFLLLAVSMDKAHVKRKAEKMLHYVNK
ncbi:TIGR04002 family protein [Faecalicatena contorta]|uniref:TIGR04002 family protein n=1 Tax=Faecalicatena contorta TaxID=39482 RepID=A0A316AKS1_9FIRM|nr:TIGR04002 family protein [Faecalicatena contorta]PWJ50617.1 putative repeat protein (TIGR04002 family) [Faecalicatena contorta]SUQ14025.1 TIGR04002 family protein [Faecalicatena contorta]